MSFCIRGITSGGGRYMPVIVAHNHQGNSGVRLFGTGAQRQLPAHPRQQHLLTSSSFLHEFLSSSNVPATSALCFHQEHKLDQLQKPESKNVCYPVYEEIIDNSNTHQMIKLNRSQPMLTANQETRWMCLSHKTSVTSPGAPAKDQTKVQFAIPGNATLHKPDLTNLAVDKNEDEKKPSNEDLVHVYETLKVDFPAFFVKSIDYRIYHPDIEFVNNIKGTTSKGIYAYVKQMAFLRTVGHLKYAYVKMDVLKITMHTHDNTVKVRWRINGLTGMKVLFNFWKFKVWKIRESLNQTEVWHDGFSTFYIGKDGLVYKHVADKMMPDDNVEEEKPKGGIPTKLASTLTFSSLH